MVDKKTVKGAVIAVLKKNNSECSVCIQNVDSGITSFSNLRGMKVSWGMDAMTLFVPRETTFRIPYLEMVEVLSLCCPSNCVEIMLTGRNLLSIMEAQ